MKFEVFPAKFLEVGWNIFRR